MSRIDMNMPNTIAMKAMILRALKLRVGICMAGTGRFAGLSAGTAVAMTRALLIVAGMNLDNDGEAGPQNAGARDFGRHFDAHWHALHNFGEIAGRIFRRQQRELRTGGRRETLDPAFDLLIRIS